MGQNRDVTSATPPPSDVAFRLVGVREVDEEELTETRRDLVAMLTAFEGHRGCTFTLQWLAFPALNGAEGGRIDVSVIVNVPADTSEAIVEEVADDVSDVLNGPPGLWTFARVTDPAELETVLRPFVANHFAEISRREESLPGADAFAGDGARQVGQYL